MLLFIYRIDKFSKRGFIFVNNFFKYALRSDVNATRPVLLRVGSLALYTVDRVAEASGSVDVPTAIISSERSA